MELVEDRPELEPDEPEQERVQQEAEDRPEAFALEPRVDRRQLGVYQPMYTPAVTTASTPEAPIADAGRNAT